MNIPAETLVRLAGATQLSILCASALVPKVLDWRGELARLSPFLRRLFWVYGVFIVLTVIGFGTLSLLFAPALASRLDAMGGAGTMARWYESQPRLVSADFTHPLPAGAARVGGLLDDALMRGYARFQASTGGAK